MIFCFNELCLNAKSAKTLDCSGWGKALGYFLKILNQAKESNNNTTPELRSENGLMQRLLSEYKQLANMANTKDYHDIYSLFFRINDKSPYMEKDKEIFLYYDESAKGLSAAYHLDAPAISFAFPNIDKDPLVTITSKHDTIARKVFNFTNEEQFKSYDLFYRGADHCQSHIVSLDHLKGKAKEHKYWERLVFSDEFQKLEIEKKYIGAIINKLCILNNFLFIDTINSLSFNDLRNVLPDVRDESGSVRNDKNKMESRTKSFAGNEVACLLHTNLDKSYRLYFKVEYQQRLIYIGYIGKHLDTGRHKGN